MNRFVSGMGWVFEDEATDGASGAAGGSGGEQKTGGDGTVVEDATGDTKVDDTAPGDKVVADVKGAPAKKDEPKLDMKSAIDAGLGYAKGPKGEKLDPKTLKPIEEPAAAAAKKKQDEEAAAAAAALKTKIEAAGKHANGTPKLNAKGEDQDDKAQPVKKAAAQAKLKTAAELDLSPEEKKALGAKTGARFGELITTLKAHEGTIGKQSETIKGLTVARENILGALKDSNTSADQLAGYLSFNALVSSGDPAQLESALKVVNEQRKYILTKLGREEGGVDLLEGHADLKKQVEEEEITRAAAVEIATHRRNEKARTEAARRAEEQKRGEHQTTVQHKKAQDDAMNSIGTWTAELQKTDLDYKAKEAKLLEQIEEVIRDYSPDRWLPTLKLLYKNTVVERQAPVPEAGKIPLRPSGAKPGEKAPTSMAEAIDQGLGYGKKAA